MAKKEILDVFKYTFHNAAESGTVDIDVDGYIVDAPTQELLREFWGDETSVSFRSIRDQIKQANPKTVNINVNSGGGHVGDAMAIHDYLIELENSGVTVNRKGIGIVASAGTYLVMGKNSSLTANCWFMIHNVQGGIWGDVDVIENYARTMRKFNNQVRDFYSTSTGLSKNEVEAMMKAETWMSATEAKEKGFVNNIVGEEPVKNTIDPDHWQYQNTTVLAAYNSYHKKQISNQMDTKTITDAIANGFSSLMEKLGIKDKTNDDATKNALSEFTGTITDAISKLPANVNEESVGKLVNDAVANAIKDLPNNEAFKGALFEATKNSITKIDLETAIANLTKVIGEKMGNKTETTEEKPGSKKLPSGPGNRFRGKYAEYNEE